jgi:hypothetical protein
MRKRIEMNLLYDQMRYHSGGLPRFGPTTAISQTASFFPRLCVIHCASCMVLLLNIIPLFVFLHDLLCVCLLAWVRSTSTSFLPVFIDREWVQKKQNSLKKCKK